MKKRKISGFLLYLLLLVAILLLYFNYLFLPLGQKISVLATQHLADEAQLEAYDDDLRNMDRLRARTSELERTLSGQKADRPLTGEEIADDLIEGFGAAGIRPSNIQVGEQAAKGGAKSSDGRSLCAVPVTLSFSCSAEQLNRFLRYCEQQSRGAYHVEKGSASAQDKTLSVSLSLSLYYFGTAPAKKS